MEEEINYYRVEQSIRYLQENFQHQPSLDDVAEHANISPFHFQRIFTQWAGISPKRFLQFLTVNFLKEKLIQSKNIIEAAESAGLSAQSRVYDLFTTLEAVTPQEYKNQGNGIEIKYGIHTTPFGNCLLGVTERGICWLAFLEENEGSNNALDVMKDHWNRSSFQEDDLLTRQWIEKIFYAHKKTESQQLNLFIKGTNFQVKVWQALLRIPAGRVTTYQEIARSIQHDDALQAVGSAVGANSIAYLIPCHRVIRKDGMLGEYRWNPYRKKSMIGFEMALDEINGRKTTLS